MGLRCRLRLSHTAALAQHASHTTTHFQALCTFLSPVGVRGAWCKDINCSAPHIAAPALQENQPDIFHIYKSSQAFEHSNPLSRLATL